MYIKMFEDFETKDLSKEVEEVWGVNPFDFRDMVLSCAGECDIWGQVNMSFTIIVPPDRSAHILDAGDFKTCFTLYQDGLKEGDAYEEMNTSLLDKRNFLVIEAGLHIKDGDWDKAELFRETTNMMLEDAKILYRLGQPEHSMAGGMFLEFIKI